MPTWEKKGNGSTLIIRPHQGMGDHLICCGMYRYLARDRDVIVLAHSGTVARNVSFMLSDLPNVAVVDYPNDQTMDQGLAAETDCEILRLGAASGEPHFNRWAFDMEFYRQANVDFAVRFSWFHFPLCQQMPLPDREYIFVHDRPDMGHKIPEVKTDLKIVGPNDLYTTFQHMALIMHAKELHCVSSSFAAFADSFNLTGKGLYFYPFEREIPRHQNLWQRR